MLDVEIESLLDEAGYAYNPATRRYDVAIPAEGEDDVGWASEDVADQLGIPLEDLQRWEAEQAQADSAGEG